MIPEVGLWLVSGMFPRVDKAVSATPMVRGSILGLYDGVGVAGIIV